MIDRYMGELDAQGAVLALTADHGMNDKHTPDGSARRALSAGWFDARLGALPRA